MNAGRRGLDYMCNERAAPCGLLPRFRGTPGSWSIGVQVPRLSNSVPGFLFDTWPGRGEMITVISYVYTV
jgi:hypothetical protein